MRRPFIAGNWKMNTNVAEAITLIKDMKGGLNSLSTVDRVLCPPFVSLYSAGELVRGTNIELGAQNMYHEKDGAFTGEISAAMLCDLGCKYVIIGHSERRTYFGETDETVNKKTAAARTAGLIPIVCVGETLAEYESGRTAEVVSRQIRAGLKGLEAEFAPKIVVAYEPVWAIGTGRASNGVDANAVIRDHIRKPMAEMYGEATAQAVRVLYGGSVTAANAAEFFGQPDIDGALVGGASLKVEEFVKITQAAVK